jgi:hypothetical protein
LIETIRSGLSVSNDPKLVDELLASYVDAKRNFYLGGLRLSAVEGGRFCEAAYRLLEQRAKGSFTPLASQLRTEKLGPFLENLPPSSQPDSIRLHIPRALRVVYDIRNKRDAAHLGDGIDPNLHDAFLVVSILDWVLSEFVRLYHSVDANEAQKIVESIVTRKAPAVQDFDGFLKVLNPHLPASDFVILLLYQRGPGGADFVALSEWVKPTMRKNLSRTLDQLTHDRAFIHQNSSGYHITATGMREVERRKLYELPSELGAPR